jgi:hypothetical protein
MSVTRGTAGRHHDGDEVLARLDDPDAFAAWVESIGWEEAQGALIEAIREHMRLNGVRSVLPLAEKMDNLTARYEEFTV